MSFTTIQKKLRKLLNYLKFPAFYLPIFVLMENEKRQQLLLHANQLFLKYGIKSVSMDDLARDLGISKKTIYQYVKNKRDLITQVLINHVEMEKSYIDKVNKEAKDAVGALLLTAEMVKEQLRSLSPTTLYDLQKYYKKEWDLLHEFQYEHIYKCTRENIVRGIEEGLYREDLDIDIISKIYVGAAHNLLDEKMFDPKKYKLEKVYIEMLKYHFSGIATKKGMTLLNRKLKKMNAHV